MSEIPLEHHHSRHARTALGEHKSRWEVLLFFALALGRPAAGQAGAPAPAPKPAVAAEHYQLLVDLDVPAQTLRVAANITLQVGAGLPDTLRLLLHKSAVIGAVTIDGQPCRFQWQASDRAANRYLPESRYLLLLPGPRPAARAVVGIRYMAHLAELAHNTSSLTPDWVALASYSAWYPANFDWGNYTYDISLGINAGYRVSGPGQVAFRRGRWHLTQPAPTSDLVLIASRRLQTKTFQDEGFALRLDYIDYAPAQADSLLATTRQAYALYKTWFGPLAGAAGLTIAATPNKGNSNYARRGFIALQTRGERPFATAKTISHEAAHLWWNHVGAGSADWNDWLNEGFAELSTLLFIRETAGPAAFRREVQAYRDEARDLPPVWLLDRAAPTASAVLYRKAPVALVDFLDQVGEKPFFALLQAAHQQRVATTADLLRLVETTVSAPARQQLEALLKR